MVLLSEPIVDKFTNSLDDSTTSDVHRSFFQAEILGNLANRHAFHTRSPKRDPLHLVGSASYLTGGPAKELFAVVLVKLIGELLVTGVEKERRLARARSKARRSRRVEVELGDVVERDPAQGVAGIIGELAEYHALATELGLDVLVEVHDESELDVALRADATLIGVNQRDLVTFEVDHERAVRMAAKIPDGAVKGAESGVRSAADAAALRTAGYDAVLVGETLVTSGDPAAAIQALSRS